MNRATFAKQRAIFKKESWMKKVEESYPKQWSSSGEDYGAFHDTREDLTMIQGATPDNPYVTSYSVYGNSYDGSVQRLLPWTYNDLSVANSTGYDNGKTALRKKTYHKSRTEARKQMYHGSREIPFIGIPEFNWVFSNELLPRYKNRKTNKQFFNFAYRDPWKVSVFDKTK